MREWTSLKMIFFDTETTGLKPGSICQLSYIIVDNAVKPVEIKGTNLFFTVDYVEPGAEDIHGFSVEKLYELSEGLYFEDCYKELITEFQSADFLIGHNINFDIGFLTHELEGCGEELKPNHLFCTMNYYKNVCKLIDFRGQHKNPKLSEVVKFLGITKDQIHQAHE